MKQLLYTSCRSGQSVTGAEGFQVRAASAGLTAERIRAVLPYVGYGVPRDADLDGAPLSPPVRLAFLSVSGIGPILCQSVAAGVDPTTHRPGNFFTHLVCDLPPDFTAENAVGAWRSTFWRQTDGPFDSVLADVGQFPSDGILDDAAVTRFLAFEPAQKLFRFALAASLAANPDTRIYIVAKAEEVALCVYALTRSLPRAQRRVLTFSTYESQPLTCPARLVGAWPAANLEEDLPSACYSGRALAFNSVSGRMSPVPLSGEFVNLTLAAWSAGNRQELEQLLAIFEQVGIERLDILNLACRAQRGGELTSDEACRLAAYPDFLVHLLATGRQRSWLAHFAQHEDGADLFATGVAPALAGNSEASAAVRAEAKQLARRTLFNGSVNQTKNLLGRMLPALDPALAASVEEWLLTDVRDPHAVPWATRSYFLTRLAAEPTGRFEERSFVHWLSPQKSELPLLCGLPIPTTWKVRACLAMFKESGTTNELAETLASHPPLLVEVLAQISRRDMASEALAALIAALLARSRSPLELLLEIANRSREVGERVTAAVLSAAARNNRVDFIRLASCCGPRLIEALVEEQGADTFLARLLDTPPEQWLDNRQLLAAARTAAKKCRPGAVREGVEALLAIRAYLDRPLLDRRSLAQTATAMDAIASPAVKTSVVEAALGALYVESDAPSLGAALEAVFEELGPIMPGGAPGMFPLILSQFRCRDGFWKQQHLICSLVSHGLGATPSGDAPGQAARATEHARDLVEEVARRSPRRVFAQLDSQSQRWSEEARLRWNLFAKYVRPRGLWHNVTGALKKFVIAMLIACLAFVGSFCWSSTPLGTGLANQPPGIAPPRSADLPIASLADHD